MNGIGTHGERGEGSMNIHSSLYAFYNRMYWRQLLSFKTSWQVKKIAIKSLLIMRKIAKKGTNE
jgi:hypothetical protein